VNYRSKLKPVACVLPVILLAVAGTLVDTGRVQAQQQENALPSFEVASLKRVQPVPPYGVVPGSIISGKVTLTNVTLVQCLAFAFNVSNDGQFAGPDWIKNSDYLYDIQAKAPPDTPKDTLRVMTLNLLKERFGLKIHHEQREIPVFVLTVDKKGSRLVASPEGEAAARAEVRPGRLVLHRVSVETLIRYLNAYTSRPIVNRTDLKGLYEVKLEWTPRNQRIPVPGGDQPQPAAPPDGSTLAEAMQEQQGLKMEERRELMDVVVVDRADKMPVAN
jgi:uncharacterized protein (TIGR03435 family)